MGTQLFTGGNHTMREEMMAVAVAAQIKNRKAYEILHFLARLRQPALLKWWEWGKIAGAVGIAVLTTMLVVGKVPSPAITALILHLAIDFTFQSAETAVRKVERGRHLLLHALIAGGLPLAVAGLVAGEPARALAWMGVGAVTHYAVDWTRRFGLRNVACAVLADQLCHLLIIFLLVPC